jgi:hypothetical protein
MTKKLECAGEQLTRRHLLTKGIWCAGAAAALGVAATSTPAAAWPQPGEKWSEWAERNVVKKSTQADAGYQPTHSGRQSCATCRNFIGTNRCAVVEGVCNPDGLCRMHYGKA